MSSYLTLKGRSAAPSGAARAPRPARQGALVACAAVLIALISGATPALAQSRTLDLYFTHTRESLKVVYKRNGRYVPSAMRDINRFLRDWRRNESTKMDPELLDLLWDVQQEFGGKQIHVVSAYRSPATNRMLRRRSRGVAKKSYHMVGKAIDFFIKGVNVSDLRKAGMKRQVGGVGYYPRSGSPFVHFDTGRVRAWPRMSRSQLARLFPDGKTLHLPRSGKPLSGYAAAKELESKGQLAQLDGGGRGLFFFGGGGGDGGGGPAGTRRVASIEGDRILPNRGSTASQRAREPDPEPEDRPVRVQTASVASSATEDTRDEDTRDEDAGQSEGRGLIRALPSVSLGGLINRFRNDGDDASSGAEEAPASVEPVEQPDAPLTAVASTDTGEPSPGQPNPAAPVPRAAPRETLVARDEDADGSAGPGGEIQLASLPPADDGADTPPTPLAYARPDRSARDDGSALGATAALIPDSAVDQPVLPERKQPERRLASLVVTRSAADAMLTPVRGASPALIADTSRIAGQRFATFKKPDQKRAARDGVLMAEGFLGMPTGLRQSGTEWPETDRFTGLSITVYASPRS